MITYQLHLIRHGLTQGNLEGRYIGRKSDLPLCEEGREELLALCDTHCYPDVQKLYRSPLLRCKQTADILYPDIWNEVLEELTECDFGEFEGKTIAELKEHPEFAQFIEGKNAMNMAPGGENTEDFNRRCVAAVEKIFRDMMQNQIRSVAVITHGGVIMSILSQLSLPRQHFYYWAVANGCGYTISITPALWQRDEGVEVFAAIPQPLDTDSDELSEDYWDESWVLEDSYDANEGDEQIS